MEPSQLKKLIRSVPDFPKPGIVFRDITPLLRDPGALSAAVELLVEPYLNDQIDVVTGPESRGFIFGASVARLLSCGFVPIRKPGRLPWKVATQSYELEYGTDTLEMHADGIRPQERVLLVDDLLATGGTVAACAELVRTLGGIPVGASFLIELDALGGRAKLPDLEIHSVLHFD